MEIEERFRELVAQCSAVSFQITTGGAWRGSAAELEKALMEDEQTRHGARSILTWPAACGVYLGRLQKTGRASISSSVVRGITQWRIESFGGGGE
jgi:hypothetical protein